MKKSFQLIFMLVGFVSPTIVPAQQFLQSASEAAVLPSHFILNESVKGHKLRSLQTDCGTDEVAYAVAKNLTNTFRDINILSGSVSTVAGGSQWFDAPQPITIKGVKILTKSLTANNTLNVSLHTATPGKTPGAELATGTVISPKQTDAAWVQIMFNSPVQVTSPYVIKVENPSKTITSQLATNYFENDGSIVSGRGENLSRALYSNTWYQLLDLFVGADCDFLFIPLVEYNVTTDFTYSSELCSKKLSNSSSPILQSRFYNSNKFNNYFDNVVDSTFKWTLADGSTVYTLDATTSSAISGSFPVNLKSSYTTWGGNVCANEKSVNINFDAEDASFSYSAESYCPDKTISIIADITGLSGGTFSSTEGLVFEDNKSGEINVTMSVPAKYTITYTTNGECPGTSSQEVTINELPVVELSELEIALCANSNNYILTGGIPVGGTYTLNETTAASLMLSESAIGTHDVIYTYVDPVTGCAASASGSIVVDVCTGVEETSDISVIKVFPNPTMGMVLIESPVNSNVEILNALGTVVLATQINGNSITSLDLGSQQNGIYFVRVTSSAGMVTRKLNLVK